MEAECSPKCW